MPDLIVSIMSIIFTSFTTIMVAVIGYKQNKRLKETEEYRKLQNENNRLIAEKEEARLVSIESKISDASDNITKLKNDININDIRSQLEKIHVLNQSNFEFSQSISTVIVLLGEYMVRSDSISEFDKKRLTSEIEDHKKKEDDITSKLVKIVM